MKDHRTQPSTRPLRWMIGGLVAVFIGLGLTTTNGGDQQQPSRPTSGGSANHEILQADANMTQRMSVPSADTARQNHLSDGQLARSQDPGYLAQLEQHQRDLDRMLARDSEP